MKKKWLIASYKINESKRVQSNLINQKFNFYLPKITIKKTNSKLKKEVLFPGYIFVNTTFNNYSALKYTKGIKNIIKFGNTIPYISNQDIKAMENVEKMTNIDPFSAQIQVGQDVSILVGPFKGAIAKICSLPSKERVDVLLTFLGSMRKITIPIKDLTL